MPRATVTTGARLHVGFGNLSLAHERLYGGVGFAVETPRAVVSARPADGVVCDDELAQEYAETAVALLDNAAGAEGDMVRGARVTVEERLPRHVGLGSGTQLALATLTAVARAHGRDPRVRKRAPALGRGGRSGVGVAAFERGGFVIDAGHPTERFTTAPPDRGDWTVPPVLARHELPTDWRVLVVLPTAEPGRHGLPEEARMRAAVETADPSVADDLATLTVRRLLPAAAEGDLAAFGAAVGEFGRLNGAWYADEQGGVYRPPAGRVVERLRGSPAVSGTGQSSWGPAVYALTDADRAKAARGAARDALDAAGTDGEVLLTRPRNEGADVTVE